MSGVRQILRARIVLVHEDSSVSATNESDNGRLRCDVLQTGAGSTLGLAVGDTVLLWQPEQENARGVILGRIGPSHAPERELAHERDPGEEMPDMLVLEAKKHLTLRVGEGSITIREDGKILIKGKDLVSHAQRMNRIKGGSVSINLSHQPETTAPKAHLHPRHRRRTLRGLQFPLGTAGRRTPSDRPSIPCAGSPPWRSASRLTSRACSWLGLI